MRVCLGCFRLVGGVCPCAARHSALDRAAHSVHTQRRAGNTRARVAAWRNAHGHYYRRAPRSMCDPSVKSRPCLAGARGERGFPDPPAEGDGTEVRHPMIDCDLHN
jgi:hypothetical protein